MTIVITRDGRRRRFIDQVFVGEVEVKRAYAGDALFFEAIPPLQVQGYTARNKGRFYIGRVAHIGIPRSPIIGIPIAADEEDFQGLAGILLQQISISNWKATLYFYEIHLQNITLTFYSDDIAPWSITIQRGTYQTVSDDRHVATARHVRTLTASGVSTTMKLFASGNLITTTPPQPDTVWAMDTSRDRLRAFSSSPVNVSTLYYVGVAGLFRLNKDAGVIINRIRRNLSMGFMTGLASIGDTLYLANNFNTPTARSALHTIDTITGTPTRIGSATNFGVGETAPSGLTSIGNTLYMIGDRRDKLYTVNTSTGIATDVGTVLNFGAGIRSASSIASIGSVLYMISASGRTDRLYTVSTSTGVATLVGNVDISNGGLIRGLASLNGLLYGITRNNTDNRLYTINPATAAATRVGSTTNLGFLYANSPGSIAFITKTATIPKPTLSIALPANQWDGVAYSYDGFWALDNTNNKVLFFGFNGIAVTTRDITLPAGTYTALCVVPDGLMIVQNDANTNVTLDFYSFAGAADATRNIALSTQMSGSSGVYYKGPGSNTVYLLQNKSGEGQLMVHSIAPSSFTTHTIGTGSFHGLADSGTDLVTTADELSVVTAPTTAPTLSNHTVYMSSRSGLYTLNTTTYAQTLVGAFSINFFNVGGLAFVDSTLYMVGFIRIPSKTSLYTINTTTGEATEIGITGTGPGTGLTSIGSTLYMMADNISNNVGNLYTVSKTTGVAVAVVLPNTQITNFEGIAAIGTTLYGVRRGTISVGLYTINTSNGSIIGVGAVANDFGIPGLNYPLGLMAIGTQLYMTSSTSLYEVNRTTGTAVLLGGSFGISPGAIAAIATNYITPVYNQLVHIDKTTYLPQAKTMPLGAGSWRGATYGYTFGGTSTRRPLNTVWAIDVFRYLKNIIPATTDFDGDAIENPILDTSSFSSDTLASPTAGFANSDTIFLLSTQRNLLAAYNLDGTIKTSSNVPIRHGTVVGGCASDTSIYLMDNVLRQITVITFSGVLIRNIPIITSARPGETLIDVMISGTTLYVLSRYANRNYIATYSLTGSLGLRYDVNNGNTIAPYTGGFATPHNLYLMDDRLNRIVVFNLSGVLDEIRNIPLSNGSWVSAFATTT